MITAKSPNPNSRPLHGLRLGLLPIPAMNRWAIFNRPLTRTSGMLLSLESGCGWVKQARIKIVVVNRWLRLICLSRSQRVDHANGFHSCLHIVDTDDVCAVQNGGGDGGQ